MMLCANKVFTNQEDLGVHIVHNDTIYSQVVPPCAETGSSRLCWRWNWRTGMVSQQSDSPSLAASRCLWMLSCSSSSWLGCQSRARMRSTFRAYTVWDGITLRCTWPHKHTHILWIKNSSGENSHQCEVQLNTKDPGVYSAYSVSFLFSQNFHDVLQLVMLLSSPTELWMVSISNLQKVHIKQTHPAHALALAKKWEQTEGAS